MDGYQKVQAVARQVLAEILPHIRPGVTETELAERCDALQRQLGVERYWYADLPALVLIGPRTCLKISRDPYQPGTQAVAHTDLVTIDLNPEIAGCWGDCARSYYVEDGVARLVPQQDPGFMAGYAAQQRLHARLFEIARPDLTFDEYQRAIQAEADALGYELIDFIGHSINRHLDDIRMVAAGAGTRLGEAGMFTLEPQIRRPGSPFAYKHENIYRFEAGHLVEV